MSVSQTPLPPEPSAPVTIYSARAGGRARLSEGDKGGGAARACLEMIALKKRLRVGLGA